MLRYICLYPVVAPGFSSKGGLNSSKGVLSQFLEGLKPQQAQMYSAATVYTLVVLSSKIAGVI